MPAPDAPDCPECDGDGLVVIGWDNDAYENIEGPCPRCAALQAARADGPEGA